MTDKEIVQALREECKTCSESPICENGTNLAGLYCANKDAANLIERLTAENTALREKVPQWISVEERLPIDRLKMYLVAFRDTFGPIVDMASYFPSDGWTCDNWVVPQKSITHWMQLPEAPEEGGKA